MNLKSIDDVSLITETETLARKERDLLTHVLHYLREIDRRRLYSSLGYKSLFDFVTRRLGYPEDQAYRRITAMKLLREIPEIEDRINRGEISLTHIGLAQALFKQEIDMTRAQKLAVFDQIANKPVREAERITLSLSSAPLKLKGDQVRAISADLIEVRFIANKELRDKVERLKGWLAHKNPSMSFGELFERLCDLGLSEWDPAKTAAPRKRRVKNNGSRAQVRRGVFESASSQCEKCGSTYALEVDHIQPQALGGASTPDNLRLLCRSCNQRAAIEVFGMEEMDPHLN